MTEESMYDSDVTSTGSVVYMLFPRQTVWRPLLGPLLIMDQPDFLYEDQHFRRQDVSAKVVTGYTQVVESGGRHLESGGHQVGSVGH
jgi:hypothetical protein